jgi:hypothetical protein
MNLEQESAAGPGQYFRSGMTVHIGRDENHPPYAVELLGLTSAVTVYFMPYDYVEDQSADEYWQVFIDMISTSARFLDDADADGVLTREDEDIILQRMNGRLTLNSRYGNWHVIKPEENLHVPFEWASIPPLQEVAPGAEGEDA